MKKSKLLYLLLGLCGVLSSQTVWSHGHGGGGFGGYHHGGGFGHRGWGGGLGGFALGYGLGYGMGYGPFGGSGLYGGYGRYGYGYPYYAYPPVVTVPSTPPVYIERTIVAPPEPNYWYYCRSSQGYYPYTKECPGGWEKVAPQPPTR